MIKSVRPKKNLGQHFLTDLGIAKAIADTVDALSLIHISEPTRPLYISYAVFCLKKKKDTPARR